MGSGAAYKERDFTGYHTIDIFNNIKVITRTGTDGKHDNTPMFSHSQNTMYAKRNKEGKVDQVTIYVNNRKSVEIDLSGTHGGRYSETEGHVHVYDKEGKKVLDRSPNKEERKIIKQVRRYNEKK